MNIKTVIAFAAGLGIGGVGGFIFAKRKYEEIAEQEIDAMREYYHERSVDRDARSEASHERSVDRDARSEASHERSEGKHNKIEEALAENDRKLGPIDEWKDVDNDLIHEQAVQAIIDRERYAKELGLTTTMSLDYLEQAESIQKSHDLVDEDGQEMDLDPPEDYQDPELLEPPVLNDTPYIIDPENAGEDHYTVESVYFYLGDDTLAAEDDTILPIDGTIGWDMVTALMDYNEMGIHEAIIRNEHLGIDYEVLINPETYTEHLTGFDWDDTPATRERISRREKRHEESE